MKIPYKTEIVGDYRVERYSDKTVSHDYFKVYRRIDEMHVATVYSEKALEKLLKE